MQRGVWRERRGQRDGGEGGMTARQRQTQRKDRDTEAESQRQRDGGERERQRDGGVRYRETQTRGSTLSEAIATAGSETGIRGMR